MSYRTLRELLCQRPDWRRRSATTPATVTSSPTTRCGATHTSTWIRVWPRISSWANSATCSLLSRHLTFSTMPITATTSIPRPRAQRLVKRSGLLILRTPFPRHARSRPSLERVSASNLPQLSLWGRRKPALFSCTKFGPGCLRRPQSFILLSFTWQRICSLLVLRLRLRNGQISYENSGLHETGSTEGRSTQTQRERRLDTRRRLLRSQRA